MLEPHYHGHDLTSWILIKNLFLTVTALRDDSAAYLPPHPILQLTTVSVLPAVATVGFHSSSAVSTLRYPADSFGGSCEHQGYLHITVISQS